MAERAKKIEEKQCKACGWQWFPRSPGRPSRCPKCSSATWDTGRRRAPRSRQCAKQCAETVQQEKAAE